MVSIKQGDQYGVTIPTCKQPGVVSLTWVVYDENVREHSVEQSNVLGNIFATVQVNVAYQPDLNVKVQPMEIY